MGNTLRSLIIILILLNSSAMVVSAEDPDGDGVDESNDLCPDTPVGAEVDADGCAASQKDSDGDGVSDTDDNCPNTESGAAIDETGCVPTQQQQDFDGDGTFDDVDAFPLDPTQTTDSDGDGFGDNAAGYGGDSCPFTYGESFSLSFMGCPDADGDGYHDMVDTFPNDPTKWGSDDDMDGVPEEFDYCVDTQFPSLVDANGCDPFQLDSDGDGVLDYYDQCPNSSLQDFVDVNGCSSVDTDLDGDGFFDAYDCYPIDPRFWECDADGDGYSESSDAEQRDACPYVSGTSTIDVFGCPDVDGDGISDIDKLLWGADSLDLLNDGFSGNHRTHTQEFDMSKESNKKCAVLQAIKVCVQFVMLIIGDVDGETTLDVQINDNLEGTSDISIDSDFEVTNSQLKIKPELRISFKYDKIGVDEDFVLPLPTPNKIYPGQTKSSLLDLYYWDEFLVLDDTFNNADESNQIEIESVDLAPIITELFESAGSNSPMSEIVSEILDNTFNLRIPFSVGFYVDTTSEYNTVSIGILDGASHTTFTQRCIDGCRVSGDDSDGDGVMDVDDLCSNTQVGAEVDTNGCAASERDPSCIGSCTATVNNNNTTSSLSVYTFAEGTVTVDIGGYLSIGIEIDIKDPICAWDAWLRGTDDSHCWEVNAYTQYRIGTPLSFHKGSSSDTFEGLTNTYTFAINGCTDSDASNQDVDAAYNDSSCTYPEPESNVDNWLSATSKSSSSIILFAGAGMGFLLLAIVVVLLFSRRIDNQSDQEMIGHGNDTHPSIGPSSPPPPLKTSPEPIHYPHPGLQGDWAEDGYEWLEFPPGQDEWYWRDQSTGVWVRH
jgi:hypothetical protein